MPDLFDALRTTKSSLDMRAENSTTIRAIAYERNGVWIAQCLEVDLAAQADSNKELILELKRVLHRHIEVSRELNADPFVNLPEAPQQYFKMFKAASDSLSKKKAPTVIGTDGAELQLAYA